MNYVDGFVCAVPNENKQEYIRHAAETAAVFKEHGALSLVETVCFSWVTWPSKQVRDSAMEKLMDDPRLNPDVTPMPFDGMRLIYGGFEVVVNE